MKRFSINVLKDENAPALALAAVVLRKYGTEAMERQPEFLRAEIEDDFNLKLTDLQSDKIQAVFTILTTDLFEAQWEVFKTVCHLLNNIPDNFDDFTKLEAEDLAAALAHYKLIIGDDEEKAKFSDEVKAYVGLILYEYGMSEPANIFPKAIMPDYAVKSDPTAKNEALDSLFDAKTDAVKSYLLTLTVE